MCGAWDAVYEFEVWCAGSTCKPNDDSKSTNDLGEGRHRSKKESLEAAKKNTVCMHVYTCMHTQRGRVACILCKEGEAQHYVWTVTAIQRGVRGQAKER